MNMKQQGIVSSDSESGGHYSMQDSKIDKISLPDINSSKLYNNQPKARAYNRKKVTDGGSGFGRKGSQLQSSGIID